MMMIKGAAAPRSRARVPPVAANQSTSTRPVSSKNKSLGTEIPLTSNGQPYVAAGKTGNVSTVNQSGNSSLPKLTVLN
jgi:hypothetical protein